MSCIVVISASVDWRACGRSCERSVRRLLRRSASSKRFDALRVSNRQIDTVKVLTSRSGIDGPGWRAGLSHTPNPALTRTSTAHDRTSPEGPASGPAGRPAPPRAALAPGAGPRPRRRRRPVDPSDHRGGCRRGSPGRIHKRHNRSRRSTARPSGGGPYRRRSHRRRPAAARRQRPCKLVGHSRAVVRRWRTETRLTGLSAPSPRTSPTPVPDHVSEPSVIASPRGGETGRWPCAAPGIA